MLGLVFLAIFSDWLDGKLARITKTVSEWGKVLDPIADKVAGLLVILALTARGDTVFTWWFVGFIVIRDVLIVSGATIISRQRRKVSMSAWSGKIAVGVLALTVFAVLLQADPPIPLYLMWASAVLYAYSFLRYFGRYLQFRQAHSDQSEDEAGNTVDSSGTTASEAAG